MQLPGGAWDTLVPFGNGTGDNDLTTAADPGDAELVTSTSRNAGYKYSEVASWSSKSLNRFGAFAFGVPTPGGAIPVSGSATYSGSVMGESDVYTFDLLATAYFRDPVQGTVNLDFDFAKGSLAGVMSLSLAGFGPVTPLGTFDFKDTVFSVGSTTYSGTFDTNADGQNFFLGQFTGPHAEETIGAWALPFVLDVSNQSITADHKTHQAFGAWIAKH